MQSSENTTARAIDWAQYAKDYTLLPQLKPYHALQVAVSEAITSHSTRNPSILDLGCGVGNLWPYLGNVSHISGLDGNAAMLEGAQQNIGARSVSTTLHDLDTSFITKLSRKYDVVVSANMLYTLTEKELFLNECCDALKEGGILVLVDPRSDMENGLILKSHAGSTKRDAYWHDLHASPEREHTLISEALLSQPELLSGMLRIAKHNRDINASHFTFFDSQELEKVVCALGFEKISMSRVYANQATCIVARKTTKG